MLRRRAELDLDDLRGKQLPQVIAEAIQEMR
jgi:hypothetical protein